MTINKGKGKQEKEVLLIHPIHTIATQVAQHWHARTRARRSISSIITLVATVR